MKSGMSSGGKGGKIIFISVVFAAIMAIFGYLASSANNYVITPP